MKIGEIHYKNDDGKMYSKTKRGRKNVESFKQLIHMIIKMEGLQHNPTCKTLL